MSLKPDVYIYGPRFGALLYTLESQSDSCNNGEKRGGTHFNASLNWGNNDSSSHRPGGGWENEDNGRQEGDWGTGGSGSGSGSGGGDGSGGGGGWDSVNAPSAGYANSGSAEYAWEAELSTHSNKSSTPVTCMVEVLVGENGGGSKLIVASSDGISSGRIDVYDMNAAPGALRPQVTIRDIPPVTCMTEIVVEDGNVDSSSCNTSKTRRLLVVGCSSSSSGELHIWDIEALINSSNTTATSAAKTVEASDERDNGSLTAPRPIQVLWLGHPIVQMTQHQHKHAHVHNGQPTSSISLAVELQYRAVKRFVVSCSNADMCESGTGSGEYRCRAPGNDMLALTCVDEHSLWRVDEYGVLEIDEETWLCCLSDSRRVTFKRDCIELRVYDAFSNSTTSSSARSSAIFDGVYGSDYTVLRRGTSDIYSAIELFDGRLATCSHSNGVQIWDVSDAHVSGPHVASGQEHGILDRCVQTLYGRALCLIQLPQGHIVTWGSRCALNIWVHDSKTNLFVDRPIVGATPNIYSVVSLSEGTLLAAAAQGSLSVHILDTATGSLVMTLNEGKVESEGISSSIRCMVPLSGERLAVGDTGGCVLVWDLPALGDQRWHRRRPLVLLLVAAVARMHATIATTSARIGSGGSGGSSSMASALSILDVVRHIASYLG